MFDDRIVVESPGKLPGLVRTENIRYTHFSRNPKIAEFLKAYSFVKEYGEGVDCMCRELESVGLRVPEYRCNAFMLQTVIYNANAKKLAIENENPAIRLENPAIQDKNPTIRAEKPDFKVKKLAIEHFSQTASKQKYAKRTLEKLLILYNEIDTNQIFGAPEIERILDCSITTSKDIMKKLRDMGVVVEVKGRGKGKYRFVNEGE